MDNAAPLEGLERSERAENLINRKIRIFYIEAIPQKISQLRKKNFFLLAHFFFKEKIFFGIVRFDQSPLKNLEDFSRNLTISKNIFFAELRNFLGYSFDVKNYYLSIYEVFSAF